MGMSRESSSSAFSNHVVESDDGTQIGYRAVGEGPAIVLIHGGGATSYILTRLAMALSDRFTVYLLDRRGRGISGPSQHDDGLRQDVEDVQALLRATGDTKLFGVSAGAIIALQTALSLPDVTHVCAFEPPLSFDGVSAMSWVPRYQREVEKGKRGAALVTIIKGTEGVRIPRFILVPVMSLVLNRADARARQIGTQPFSDQVLAMRHDIRVVQESSGSLERYRGLRCEVLLMGGTKSPPYLKAALDGLAAVVPRAQRVTIPEAGHRAPNNDGRPELVADHLAGFFACIRAGVPADTTTGSGGRDRRRAGGVGERSRDEAGGQRAGGAARPVAGVAEAVPGTGADAGGGLRGVGGGPGRDGDGAVERA